jgi:hypothetical protein
MITCCSKNKIKLKINQGDKNFMCDLRSLLINKLKQFRIIIRMIWLNVTAVES